MARRKRSTVALVSQRDASLGAIPHQLDAVRTEPKDEKLYVTIRFERPRWQQVLGADSLCERTFGLDDYGRLVYESCDGQRTVRQIIQRFANRTRVSHPEAEVAVTKFLRTLIAKGLVAMQMEKPAA